MGRFLGFIFYLFAALSLVAQFFDGIPSYGWAFHIGAALSLVFFGYMGHVADEILAHLQAISKNIEKTARAISKTEEWSPGRGLE